MAIDSEQLKTVSQNRQGGGKLRPWEAIGMSRASWYRHGKPTTKSKPKETQKDLSEILGCSVRTVQRDLAEAREKQRKEQRQKNVARVREYMAQGYTQDEACSMRAAELRAGAIEELISKGGLVAFAEAVSICRQDGQLVR